MDTVTDARRVSPDRLRCALGQFALPDSTDTVRPLDHVVGQTRAQEAIAFGLQMSSEGYNIVLSGPPGSGRNTIVELLVGQLAATRQAASDWVYVHNFSEPRRPRAISLPAGRGEDLRAAVAELADACRVALPRAFDSDTYQDRLGQELAPINATREAAFRAASEFARERHFVINTTPMGLMAAPLGRDGSPLAPEAFAALPEEAQREIEKRAEAVQEQIGIALREMRRLDGEARKVVQKVDRDIMRFVLGHLLDDLKTTFGQLGLQQHCEAIESDIAANLDVYKRFTDTMLQQVPPHLVSQATEEREALLRRYSVNLFVSHGKDTTGVPVLFERHPSYQSLFGRVDFENRFGTATTDFTRLQAGSVHTANGGYLIIQAQEVLAEPLSWPKLKEALKTHEVSVELPALGLTPIPMIDLVPESIGLDLKVVLIAEPHIVAMLDLLDPDFVRLFKVRAEFEPDTDLTSESVDAYVRFMRHLSDTCGSPPFTAGAIKTVVQFGSRLAGRQDRLSTRYGVIADLCQESAALAGPAAVAIEADHVERAIDGRRRRSELIPDRMRRMISEGTIHIETSGAVVGQVNGLAVYAIGDHAFGTPIRITCRVGMGRRGVVAIERETERSGAVHSKGVLVLSGFLMGMFGRIRPLAFNASLTFEQTYEQVEGDSASSAELYAILASLADVRIRQDIAVTGSVDQFGNIQPVGGVTEKVEGFFDVCSAGTLSGTQGVIIPRANCANLTLRSDVVEAVEQGRFHLWAIDRIEDGLELLTGIPAGSVDQRPSEDTVYGRVVAALEKFRELAAHEKTADE